MFALFQGVHESKGVSEDYLKLESLLQKVVSPYLGTYGLYSSEGPFTHSACILGKDSAHSLGTAHRASQNLPGTLLRVGPGPAPEVLPVLT